ncbi:MAG: PfkB family carbohydrate kinase [Methylobacter sp.]|nr:PfkB family carbohydrate kinase [Methylobacter sp.]
MTNPILIFGEVLFDHFPDGSCVLGGAPFNVAWHLQAFGQQPCFISRVGLDAMGDAVLTAMQEWQMDVSGLQRDRLHPTGTVQVSIEQGEPSYAIVPEQAYDFIAASELPMNGADGLLYHGSLALRHEVSRRALAALKQQHRGKLFMDVNLREPWWNKTDIVALVDDADWAKLNHHELQALQPEPAGLDVAMSLFLTAHKLEGLIVTLGERGALAINAPGESGLVTPTQTVEIVDTVGAGDAFASVLMLGINLGWPLQLTLERAQAFASALVGRRGATIQDIRFYRPFVQSWMLR